MTYEDQKHDRILRAAIGFVQATPDSTFESVVRDAIKLDKEVGRQLTELYGIAAVEVLDTMEKIERIRSLRNTTLCSLKHAKLALEFAEYDLETAKRLIRKMDLNGAATS